MPSISASIIREGGIGVSTHIRTACLLALAFGLPLAVTTSASAIAPEIVRIADIHIEQTDSTSCDFPFQEVFDGRATITTYFDSAGTPISVRFQLPFRGTLTNEATGESVQAQQSLNVVLDLENGTETDIGLRFRAVFPGIGAVLLDAGRVVFDESGAVIFSAGPHQVVNEDFEEFCAAFAS
jgi:hypothetical protein